MKPIRIAAIIPYEGMALLIGRVVRQFPEIELSIVIGDMEEGVQRLRELRPEQYDILISRGGTAELLRRYSAKPVVEIQITVYDILRTLRLIKNYSGKHAIIGFPSITSNAYALQNLISSHNEIITIHSADEVNQLLRRLKENGYEMIVGDMITCQCAKKYNLDSVLITSGEESISEAINAAVKQVSNMQLIYEQNMALRALLKHNQMVVFDRNEKMIINDLPEELKALENTIQKNLGLLKEKKSITLYKKMRIRENTAEYAIMGQQMEDETGFGCYAFSVKRISYDDVGIRYLSKEEIDKAESTNYYNSWLHTLEMEKQLASYLASPLPILLDGEEGVGKESLVNLVYTNSPYNTKPLVCIDCSVLADKEWYNLTTQVHSPFFDTSRMIFFNHCESFKKPVLGLFLSFLEETALSGSNKLIFSFTSEPGQENHGELQDWLIRKHALSVYLPPLRDRIGDAYNMISLSISSLNQILGKHIIDVEPAALLTLQQYEWPGNYTQFYNLLTKMMLLSNADIITDRVVREVLADHIHHTEKQRPSLHPAFNYDLKLQEHIAQIVQHVLEKEGFNQTRAAKRLGISRSTLWRLTRAE